MNFTDLFTGAVIGLFVWYMISVTRAYNRKDKLLANQGSEQVIHSMFRVLNDPTGTMPLQFIPETMESTISVPLLDDVIDGIRGILERWADVNDFQLFSTTISRKGSWINHVGHRSHFILIVTYQCDDKPVVAHELNLDVHRLGRHTVHQDVYLDILNGMTTK